MATSTSGGAFAEALHTLGLEANSPVNATTLRKVTLRSIDAVFNSVAILGQSTTWPARSDGLSCTAPDPPSTNKAYFVASQLCHPDKNPEDPAGATLRFLKLTEAHDLLQEQVKNGHHDEGSDAGGDGRRGYRSTHDTYDYNRGAHQRKLTPADVDAAYRARCEHPANSPTRHTRPCAHAAPPHHRGTTTSPRRRTAIPPPSPHQLRGLAWVFRGVGGGDEGGPNV